MALTAPQAYTEHQRIRHLPAFNIDRAAQRTSSNQHMTQYTFPDGSKLQVGRGWAKSSDEYGNWVCHGTIQTQASRFMGD